MRSRAGNGEQGTGNRKRGTRDKGTAKTADDGRRPGTRLRSGKPELRRAGRGTGKIQRHLEPATGGQTLELPFLLDFIDRAA